MSPNHTSKTQLAGWKQSTQEIFDTYNASPRGQSKPEDPCTLASRITGTLSDHAADQQKLGGLVKEWKVGCDRELHGEHAMASMDPAELLLVALEETAALVQEKGSHAAWAVADGDALQANGEAVRAAVIRWLGDQAYLALLHPVRPTSEPPLPTYEPPYELPVSDSIPTPSI